MQELTERQLDIARMKAEGKSSKEIAALLGITPSGVSYHLKTMEYNQVWLIQDARTRAFLIEHAWDLSGGPYENTHEFLKAVAQVPVSRLKRFRKVGPDRLARLGKCLKDAGVIEDEAAWLDSHSEAYDIIKGAWARKSLEYARIFLGDAQDLERLLALNGQSLHAIGLGERMAKEVAEALEEAGKIPSAAEWLKRKAVD